MLVSRATITNHRDNEVQHAHPALMMMMMMMMMRMMKNECIYYA